MRFLSARISSRSEADTLSMPANPCSTRPSRTSTRLNPSRSSLRRSPRWRLAFYRTAAGAEIDLVAERGQRRLAFEIKLSSAPTLVKGLHQAVADLQPERTWIVAPVESGYPLAEKVEVLPAHRLANGIPGLD